MIITGIATDPPVSEAQRRAMFAAARGKSTLGIPKSVGEEFVQAKDAKLSAAGIMFADPNGNALFLRRSDSGDHAGEWCFPGGKIEEGETPQQTAQREAEEETGQEMFLEAGPLTLLNRATNADGVDFITFKQSVVEQFTPDLDGEHTDYLWAPLSKPPQPLHPGVDQLLKAGYMPSGDKALGIDKALAFDKSSVRIEDRDGRLHVSLTHISKATVNPYLGKEIPNYQDLGLDPEKIYQLLRDPEELKKGAATFNNLPILDEHVRVTADEHHPDRVVGSTGTDAVFNAPYLDNSLVVWTKGAISLINSEEKKELSSAYYYRADMTPGVFEGVKFDGVMRDIVGNHVALVEKGRAGRDVVVGDSMENIMKAKKKPGVVTRIGLITSGALAAHLRPLLAADAEIDLSGIVGGLSAKNFKSKKAGIVTAVTKACDGKLAKDADLDQLTGLLDALEKNEVKEGVADELVPNSAAPAAGKTPGKDESDADMVESEEGADDDGLNEKLKEFLTGKLSDEDLQAVTAMLDAQPAEDEPAEREEMADRIKANEKKGAKDEFPDKKEKKDVKNDEPKVTKAAMDAEIRKATKIATDNAIKTQREIRAAEEAVKPYVGGGMAEDAACASDVYKAALTAMDIDVADVTDPNAYKHILLAQPLPGKGEKKPTGLAQDAANTKEFSSRFPGLNLPGVA